MVYFFSFHSTKTFLNSKYVAPLAVACIHYENLCCSTSWCGNERTSSVELLIKVTTSEHGVTVIFQKN